MAWSFFRSIPRSRARCRRVPLFDRNLVPNLHGIAKIILSAVSSLRSCFTFHSGTKLAPAKRLRLSERCLTDLL